jgi:hypothetical protein
MPGKKVGDVPKAKPASLTAAIEGFIADKDLDGREQVVGALMVELAQSFEEAPPYARGRLGAEIRTCLSELQYALGRDEERSRRVRERSWIQAERNGEG